MVKQTDIQNQSLNLSTFQLKTNKGYNCNHINRLRANTGYKHRFLSNSETSTKTLFRPDHSIPGQSSWLSGTWLRPFNRTALKSEYYEKFLSDQVKITTQLHRHNFWTNPNSKFNQPRRNDENAEMGCKKREWNNCL